MKTHNGVKYRIILDEFAIRRIKSGLSISGTGTPALAALNGTDVAFIDSSNISLMTYRFGFALATPYHP
jgi:hypothetical protein